MWIARTAEKVTETVSPKNAEGIHYTVENCRKLGRQPRSQGLSSPHPKGSEGRKTLAQAGHVSW